MSWKIFWCGAGVVGVLVAVTVWAASTATFLYRHPMAKDVRVVIDRQTGAAVVEAFQAGVDPALRPEPRVRVDETTYNFGVMDPQVTGKHEFRIQNIGGGPLELKFGGTTCKCTIGGVSDNIVPPGKSATMTMDWNTGRYNPQFTQSAIVRTNDPLNKEIEFTIEGQIRSLITAEPRELALGAGAPGVRLKAEFLLYSQSWDSFEITGVSGQLPNLTWRVETVSELAADWQALSARRVKLEFDSPVKQGRYSEQLRIDVKSPDANAPPHHLYVHVTGSMARLVAWYGPTITNQGIIDLGNLTQGKGIKTKLIAKVRDDNRDLGECEVEAFPSFLKVNFAPQPESQTGLYNLTIELPEDTPVCQYLGDPIGRIRIKTGHSTVGTMEILVSFAVLR
ncbi:MAG: DUF1573 domain-containing protein [Pirellulaceae bacterium]|nr:DUF1573 domain-containing protein [Pirellulaceae bacterium]